MFITVSEALPAAGGKWNIPCRHFRLIEAAAAVTVELGIGGRVENRLENVLAGAWVRSKAGEPEYDFIRIIPSVPQTVSFIVTDGESGYDRAFGSVSLIGTADVSDRAARLLGIVYGTLDKLAQVLVNAVNYLRVQVQGQGDAETDASSSMLGYGQQVAVGAQLSHVQLLNPAGSARTFYVDKVRYYSTAAAGQVSLGQMNAAATTDVASKANKNVGGAAPAGQVRKMTNAASQLTAFFGLIQVPADLTQERKFNPPLKLEAGEGIALQHLTVNVTLTAEFEWREYA